MNVFGIGGNDDLSRKVDKLLSGQPSMKDRTDKFLEREVGVDPASVPMGEQTAKFFLRDLMEDWLQASAADTYEVTEAVLRVDCGSFGPNPINLHYTEPTGPKLGTGTIIGASDPRWPDVDRACTTLAKTFGRTFEMAYLGNDDAVGEGAVALMAENLYGYWGFTSTVPPTIEFSSLDDGDAVVVADSAGNTVNVSVWGVKPLKFVRLDTLAPIEIDLGTWTIVERIL